MRTNLGTEQFQKICIILDRAGGTRTVFGVQGRNHNLLEFRRVCRPPLKVSTAVHFAEERFVRGAADQTKNSSKLVFVKIEMRLFWAFAYLFDAACRNAFANQHLAPWEQLFGRLPLRFIPSPPLV